jgi:outer membrane lipoprotein-sorting protein
LALALVLVAAGSAQAATAREVLDKARELSRTERKWTDRTQKLKLSIVDRRGGTRERELEVLQKKYEEDRSKSILFFEAPPEIKGTGFLQWIDPHDQNQQWLYLPELKRVRQISGSNKRESFMGTDFSYEDLAVSSEILDWSEADAEARIEREERCEPEACWVILFTPKAKQLAYGGIRTWVDDRYRLRRFEFLNDKGEVLKRLAILDIRDVGAIPTAFRFEMDNVRGGSRTIVDFVEVTYDTGISDGMFTERRLEKGL